MARLCIICHNGLSKFCQRLADEGYPPKVILQKIYEHNGIIVNYRQYRHHCITHEQNSASIQIQRNQARAYMTKTKKGLQVAEEMIEDSRELLVNVQNFFASVLSHQNKIDPEKFAALPPDKQAAIINQTIGSMARLKSLEMQQQRLDMEQSPVLENIFKIASRAGMSPALKKKLKRSR